MTKLVMTLIRVRFVVRCQSTPSRFGLAPFHRTRSKFDFYYVYMHRSMNKIVEITGDMIQLVKT